MNSYKKKRLADGKDSCDADILNEFMDRYDTLVAAGNSVFQSMSPKKFGYDELRKMLARLRDYKDAYTLFIRDLQHLSPIIWRRGTLGHAKPDKTYLDVLGLGVEFQIM